MKKAVCNAYGFFLSTRELLEKRVGEPTRCGLVGSPTERYYICCRHIFKNRGEDRCSLGKQSVKRGLVDDRLEWQ